MNHRTPSTPARPLHPILALALATTLVGCGIGPDLKREVSIPEVQASLAGKEIVVSGFKVTSQSVSVTNSYDIQTTLETVRTGDVSAEIATELQAAGIPATARVDFKPSSLREDQLLLRGALINGRSQPTGLSYLNFAIWPLTVLIVGGVVPTPIAYENVRDVQYRLELIDSEGRIVLHVNDDNVSSIKDYYAWGTMSNQERRDRDALQHAQQIIVAELAKAMRSAGADVASLASDQRKVARDGSTLAAASNEAPDEIAAGLEAARDIAREAEALLDQDPIAAEARAAQALRAAERSLRREDVPLVPFLSLLSRAQYAAAIHRIDHGEAATAEDAMAMMDLPCDTLGRAYRICLDLRGPEDPMTQRVGTSLRGQYGEDGVRRALQAH